MPDLKPVHTFRYSRHIFRFRVGALSFFALLLSIVATLCLGFLAFYQANGEYLQAALIGLGLTVALAIIYRIAAGSVRCPLCRSHPLLSHACQKHRKAERLFGSYRLNVVTSLLFKNNFRCPYCGESSACRVKPSEKSPTKPRRSYKHY